MNDPDKPKPSAWSPKKRNPKKKLKSLKKLKSFPEPGQEGSKVSVQALLHQAISKSSSMTNVNDTTVLVPHSRLKINLEGGNDGSDDLDSQMSPGRSLMHSHRSCGSNSLDGSEYTMTTRRTQREMVHEIKQRAERNLGPPSFVTPIEDLLPRQISWNQKVPQNSNPYKPQVNIIGCQQSMELILAQADLRSRHRQETLEVRQKLCDEKVRAIDEAIQIKYTRAERYAEILEFKQRQIKWIKIIKLCVYLSRLHSEMKHHLVAGAHFLRTVQAAVVIREACKCFMKRHLLLKFKCKFMVLFRKQEANFRMALRIHRKRRAMRKIMTFLTEFKSHHRVKQQFFILETIAFSIKTFSCLLCCLVFLTSTTLFMLCCFLIDELRRT